jgi:precorrin-3B synthase
VTSPPALDACPGLLALHPARDGHVARIRLPGGYVTGRRWRSLAALASDFGNGCLDLTARGNVQLRGVAPPAGPALAERAAAAGLLPSAAHDRARNIMASPLAGLGGHPALRQLVSRLDALLLGDPEFAALPGRFLFSADDGSGGAGLASCDVGLRRAGDGVDIVLAGRHAGVRVAVAAAPAVAAAATRAALARGVGASVLRIADLPDGGESVAAAVGGSLGAPAAGRDARLALGMPGQRETGRDRTRSGEETLVVGARLGRVSASQMLLIASLLRAREVIRLGIAGRLVLPLAAGALTGAAQAGPAQDRLADAGLIVSGDDPLADVTACSGTACSRALADVRAVAGPVAGQARTHWAGCARQCGLPPDAEPVIAVDADHFLVAGRPEPLRLPALVTVA